MKLKSFITAAFVGTTLLTGCADQFADTNKKPSVVNDPDIRFLFTKALSEFEASKYQHWFYNNNKYYLPWAQATVTNGGNLKSLNLMGEVESQAAQVIKVKVITEEIEDILANKYDENKSATYENIRVLGNVLNVYLGIFGTDMYGSMPYTEAAKALVTNPPILTPKYDSQEELFTTWLNQLDETISILGENRSAQVALDSQDFIYKGDIKKWAKLANSLKLRIAVRMLHVDKAGALAIAKEVTDSPAGVMESIADDFIYNKGSQDYHFWDNITTGYGSEGLINLLVANKDPRVRAVFAKNDFNATVVQTYLNEGKAIPEYINKYIKTKEVDGKKVFNGWEAPGEPWVRYHGAPVSVTARENAGIDSTYFNENFFKIKIGDSEKSYQPLALFNQEMIRGSIIFTYPNTPGDPVIQDKRKAPWHGLYMSAAEVQFYLAELKLMGATLPKTADTYFTDGISLSVEAHDNLAKLNKIPYYDNLLHDALAYDVTDAAGNVIKKGTPIEQSIALKNGELEALLQQKMCKLTGSNAEQLEKVYIQQYINFLLQPNELFAMSRRSGIPKVDSNILPLVPFAAETYAIPRRFKIDTPTQSDLMYIIKKTAYEEQGYTLSTDNPEVLNKERVWYDMLAPNFGEGPKL